MSAPRRLHSAWWSWSSAALAGLALIAGCARGPIEWALVEELATDSLSALPARLPELATDGRGHVALTFVTVREGGGADAWIALSADSGASFAAPRRLNTRDGAVVADVPCGPRVAFGGAGRVVALWSETRAGAVPAVDVVAAASTDGGATFAAPVTVNDDAGDARPSVHRMPAAAFLPSGALFAVWLDDRERRRGTAPTASAWLFGAWSEDGGATWGDNEWFTDRICACCPPTIAAGEGGAVGIGYRSAAWGARDPGLLLLGDEGDAEVGDTLLAPHHWRTTECPSEGVAIAALGKTWDAAWRSGAATPEVSCTRWEALAPDRRRDDDESPAFRAGPSWPLADSLQRVVHPSLSRADSTAWLGVEGTLASEPNRSVFAVRTLGPDGTLSPWCFLGAAVDQSALVALSADHALAAWIERGALRVTNVRRRGRR